MPANTVLYPSETFPALPDGVYLRTALDLFKRMDASLSSYEQSTAIVNNLAQVRVRCSEEPTPDRALRKAKTALQGAVQSGTPLTITELQDLLTLIQAAQA